METKGNRKRRRTSSITERTTRTELPLVQDIQTCDFNGYDADALMKETAKLRKVITKRGTHTNPIMLHYHTC